MFHRSSPSLRDHMRMASCVPGELIPCAFVWHDPGITPCCKSLFALLIKNSPGCRRDFHVKMWGTSSPDDKLTGDLGNAFEAAEIGGRWSDRLLAGKLSSGDFGLLQQYRHKADKSRRLLFVRIRSEADTEQSRAFKADSCTALMNPHPD